MQVITKNAFCVNCNTVPKFTLELSRLLIRQYIVCYLHQSLLCLRRHVVSYKIISEGTCWLNHFPLNMEHFPTNSLQFCYQISPYHLAEDHNLKAHKHESVISQFFAMFMCEETSRQRFFLTVFQFKAVNYTTWLNSITYHGKGTDWCNLCLYTYHTRTGTVFLQLT